VLIALRVIGLAVVIALTFTMVAWLVTRERRWLRLTWLIFKYAVFGLAFVLLLFAGESLWRAA
jgi:cell division protein FtsW (lipid II flippase)